MRAIVQLVASGRPVVTWDAAEHPRWPPVDNDGELIGDLPWKFFDPEAPQRAECPG